LDYISVHTRYKCAFDTFIILHICSSLRGLL